MESESMPMDAIAACGSGHLGLPLGTAEIGAPVWHGTPTEVEPGVFVGVGVRVRVGVGVFVGVRVGV